MMYCLVDRCGKVFTNLGASSYDDAAHRLGVNESECQEYRYDLAERRLFVDRATPQTTLAVEEAVNQNVGNPERLMTFAREGHVPKQVMVTLLSADQREPYLEACTAIERRITDACTHSGDNCLATGCSVKGTGEVCLQPLLNAGAEYHKACAAEWIKLFRAPDHRIEAWKH